MWNESTVLGSCEGGLDGRTTELGGFGSCEGGLERAVPELGRLGAREGRLGAAFELEGFSTGEGRLIGAAVSCIHEAKSTWQL